MKVETNQKEHDGIIEQNFHDASPHVPNHKQPLQSQQNEHNQNRHSDVTNRKAAHAFNWPGTCLWATDMSKQNRNIINSCVGSFLHSFLLFLFKFGNLRNLPRHLLCHRLLHTLFDLFFVLESGMEYVSVHGLAGFVGLHFFDFIRYPVGLVLPFAHSGCNV